MSMRDNTANPKHGIYCHERKVKYLKSIWKIHVDDLFVIATASRTITEKFRLINSKQKSKLDLRARLISLL